MGLVLSGSRTGGFLFSDRCANHQATPQVTQGLL